MRQSVRKRARGASQEELPPIYFANPREPEPQPEVAAGTEATPTRAEPPPGVEDWSHPERQPRMSIVVPLLWLAVPLLGCIAYGLLASHWGGP